MQRDPHSVGDGGGEVWGGRSDLDQLGSLTAAGGPLCRCGHARRAHEHYRRGSDCALCDCPRFRGRRWWPLPRR